LAGRQIAQPHFGLKHIASTLASPVKQMDRRMIKPKVRSLACHADISKVSRWSFQCPQQTSKFSTVQNNSLTRTAGMCCFYVIRLVDVEPGF
jgi:hypothetical protein